MARRATRVACTPNSSTTTRRPTRRHGGPVAALGASVAATALVFGASAAAAAQADTDEAAADRSVAGGAAVMVAGSVVDSEDAVLRGAEILARLGGDEIAWLAGETAHLDIPPVPDEHGRRRLVEALGSETLVLWCRDGGDGHFVEVTGLDMELALLDVVDVFAVDATAQCAGSGGGVLVADGTVAMLLCVDSRVIASPTQGASSDSWDAGAAWCPEPAGATPGHSAATPIVFVCPATDVIASTTGGTTSDFWDPDVRVIASSTEGSSSDLSTPPPPGALRCPGTAQRLGELLEMTAGADPLAELRSMLHAYGANAGHDGSALGVTEIAGLFDSSPELRDLAAVLGHASLDGRLDIDILAASRSAPGLIGLNDLELRAALHHTQVLAEQLESWASGLAAPRGEFKVEIEGVTQGAFAWLEASATTPRLFDEADALFGKAADTALRTAPSRVIALDRDTPDRDTPDRDTPEPPPSTVARPTPATVAPERPTATAPPRPASTLAPDRPATTVARPAPTTTAPDRTTNTTPPTTATLPTTSSTTSPAPRPTTTAVTERPPTSAAPRSAATTVAPERPPDD